MGKHSSGGWFGSSGSRREPSRRRRPDAERARIPAEQILTPETDTPLETAPRRRSGIESAPARLRAERERRRKRTRGIVLGVLALVVVLVLAGAAAAFAWVEHLQKAITVSSLEKLTPQLDKAPAGDPFNILLLGADYRKGDTSYRTDTIVVARIDPQTKKVWMISIPRDTRALIPGHGYQKINAAHTFGGPDLVLETVKQFTGLPISHYMEVNFTGFEDAVNAMGGVWVTVPQAIDDPKAARNSVHDRAAVISKGYQKLDGEHALTFVRSRDGYADQDISRMKAQQIFFRAVADQLAKSTDIPKTIRVVNAITPYIQTDMNIMDLMKTALAMKGMGSQSLYTATLTGPWKTPFIYTDQTKMAEIIAAFKAGEPFTPEMAPSALQAPVNVVSTTTTSGVVPAKVKVTVKNGWTVTGVGSQVANILKARNFNVVTVGNANQKNYAKTIVVYKTKRAYADAVAAALMPGTQVIQSAGKYTMSTEVLVVVGKDWDATKVASASGTTQ